jgi:hypothetical protein
LKEEKEKAKAEKAERKRLEKEEAEKYEADKAARDERNRPWNNPFDKYEILEIWRTADRRYLNTDDERECYKLLMKYNGPWTLKVDLDKQNDEREKNKSNPGAHVNWSHPGNTQTQDIDLRSRQLLLEIDRAMSTSNEWMDTKLLHAANQRFPTDILRLQLEDELDNILKNQIQERERQDRVRLNVIHEDDNDSEDEPELDTRMSFFGKKEKKREKTHAELIQEQMRPESGLDVDPILKPPTVTPPLTSTSTAAGGTAGSGGVTVGGFKIGSTSRPLSGRICSCINSA